MKQNNSNIKLLIKQPKYSILIICLLLSSISGLSQTTTELLLNYEFNPSSLGEESETRNFVNGVSKYNVVPAKIKGFLTYQGQNLINFRDSGLGGLKGLNGMATNNNDTEISNLFNPESSSFTIITRILIDNTFNDDYSKNIFWFEGANGNPIFGLERYKQQLVFDRYVRSPPLVATDLPSLEPIKSTWKFNLWEPKQFDSNDSTEDFRFYYIAISVSKNLFRVKVFQPGYDPSAYAKTANNPNGNNCGRCELVYLGGQTLKANEVSQFGFGGFGDTSTFANASIYAMDFFRVYGGEMTFDDIDAQYNTDLANNFAKSGNGKTKETLGLTPEESVFAMHIYPNPTSGKFTLNFTLLNQDKIDYNLYSLDGKEVLTNTGQVFGSGIHNLEIDASHLASGIYFLNVKSGEHLTKIYKIIIE
ncbi:hypothetical protein BST83_11680 [Polaribacter filamentus]|uniref:Secretion system C-terminal sorting domain-containing protein n=1 Tax=Polaribacter filamentus TaxID=53483 RepID=A0A2S7KYP5_9FLAO|nr:T9SS type A sorting domain-containing protein [Polaribacter filamentus]PQB07740.1 hypothetical protein BST83_11680 [Polaribacter filamentus]